MLERFKKERIFMKPIIYYGVGKRLKKNEETYLSETGFPACMCDSDIKKINEVYYFIGGINAIYYL